MSPGAEACYALAQAFAERLMSFGEGDVRSDEAGLP
jgi:hypothetical protein